jgi:hypothetical protein
MDYEVKIQSEKQKLERRGDSQSPTVHGSSQEQVERTLAKFDATAVVVGHTLNSRVKALFDKKAFAIDVKHPWDYRVGGWKAATRGAYWRTGVASRCEGAAFRRWRPDVGSPHLRTRRSLPGTQGRPKPECGDALG